MTRSETSVPSQTVLRILPNPLAMMICTGSPRPRSGYSATYAYNAIGNLISQTRDGASITYSYGAGGAGPHAVTGKILPNPVVDSFVINGGSPTTDTQLVTLDNVCLGRPTEYMASEDASFSGAAWQPYSIGPIFALSEGFGFKTVYFKVKNVKGVLRKTGRYRVPRRHRHGWNSGCLGDSTQYGPRGSGRCPG